MHVSQLVQVYKEGELETKLVIGSKTLEKSKICHPKICLSDMRFNLGLIIFKAQETQEEPWTIPLTS